MNRWPWLRTAVLAAFALGCAYTFHAETQHAPMSAGDGATAIVALAGAVFIGFLAFYSMVMATEGK